MRKGQIPLWWEKFAVEYLKNNENGAQAYLKARPHVKLRTATVESCKLLTNPNFQKILAKQRELVENDIGMTRREYFAMLSEKAKASVLDFVDEQGLVVEEAFTRTDRHAVRSIIKTKRGLETTLSDDIKAMELIGKAAGFLKDKLDVSPNSKGGLTIQWDSSLEVV